MIILGIETSCDDTALSLLEVSGTTKNPEFKVLGEANQSQIHIHKKYGGVFPVLAKREHAKNLIPLFKKLLTDTKLTKLSKAKIPSELKASELPRILEKELELLKQFQRFIPKIQKPPIDAIAVTVGPGLEPALWVGINFARALSYIWNIPLVPTNHIEGHILSILESNSKIKYPALALVISGGHTELVYAKKHGCYKIVGETRDDAVGEAFDKVARMLGLPYPGGPEISRLAEKSRGLPRSQNPTREIKLPRPMINSKDLDFSFSGLKTAVLYLLRTIKKLTPKIKQEIAREFEDSVVDVLVSKTEKALVKYPVKTLILGGGVIANKEIRKNFTKLAEKYPEISLHFPTQNLSTDNAVMIAIAGFYAFKKNKKARKNSGNIIARGNLRLTESL
jgi:N6-L-threonylcarbamoyladenine synthase